MNCYARCAVGLLSALILASCASTPPPAAPASPPQPLLNLSVTPQEITTAKPGTGEPLESYSVQLTLAVQAPTGHGIDATLPTTQVYDFYVMYSGVEVWRWSNDKEFFAQATPFELPPGTGLTFTETWIVDAGDYVAGDYKVVAVVQATGETVSAPFTIRYP
ncbi:MAG: hypothetical protein IT368_06830 [Candidatus Hydrogenedentes bacterium]|nr:hypothetical protein [Candidatus Hydrogenedentota bacterium]